MEKSIWFVMANWIYYRIYGFVITLLLFTTSCKEKSASYFSSGEKLFAVSPLRNKNIEVEIVSSHYVDPKGERVRS